MKKRSLSIRPAEVPIVILAGGRGTRLLEETQVVPKPMVTIGGQPILLHLMRYYAAFGFRRFVLCLGYKGHVIKEYFLRLPQHTADLVVFGRSGRHRYATAPGADWEIALVETGEHSLTGTRLYHARAYLDAPHIGLTYGDGLSDLPLDRELEFHLRHGRIGTVAAVHPPSRFGMLDLDAGGRVRAFREKETLKHDYINGGFFFFRRAFLDRLSPTKNQSLESEPLAQLAAAGELMAFRHEGFWKCMDTLRDRETLEAIYEQGAPWVRG